MGESRSVTEFAGKIVAGGTAIAAANTKAVKAASLVAKETIVAAAAPDTGGDMVLSRWRSGKGIKLGVGFAVKAAGPELAVGVVSPRPLGVWKILEHGATSHPIVPGISKKRRRAGRNLDGRSGPVLDGGALADMRTAKGKTRVLSFGPGQVAAHVQHPGSKAKGTWSTGVEAARPVAVAAFTKTHNAALLAAFR